MDNSSILQTGRNCWRIRRADKVAFLIDGAAYFKALYESLPLGEQQILILSWDIYSQLNLVPPGERETHGQPTQIARLLNRLTSRAPGLHVNILSWDFSLLFAMDREWLPVYKLDWTTHRRLRFCLDDNCPVGASHHQKVVVLDDALAFAGGLDLTRGRWDTPEHRSDDSRRALVDGTPLPIRPYHDVQMAVSGPAAEALGSLARERWRRGAGEQLPRPENAGREIWPSELAVDIRDVDVAIVRTEPAWGDFVEVRETEQLYLDAIAAARNYIYIENQYLTAPTIGQALAARLAEADGPEVVLNLPLHVEGWLSQQSMDMMRVGIIRTLREADRHGRLGVYYPDKPDAHDLAINLHAKLMIIDDRFVRVGSANLNNRSMGLDTECDLAIEAGADEKPTVKAIRHFRNRLVAEHLDCEPGDVDAEVHKQGSLLKAIEVLRGKDRTLSPLIPRLPEPDERELQDIQLADPERPVDPETVLNHFVPEKQARPAGLRIVGWITALVLLLAAAAAWRFTPLHDWLSVDALGALAEQWRGSSLTPLIVIAAFVVGGLLVMPVTAMIIVAALIFGPWTGFIYALAGSVASALSGYALGTLLGRKSVRELGDTRINAVSRQLAKRGLLTMLVVRIVPVAPFTVVNLVAGASHISFRDFALGTFLGMTPGIIGVIALTDRVRATLRTPDWQTLLTLVIVAAVVFTAGYALSRRLLELAKNNGAPPNEPER